MRISSISSNYQQNVLPIRKQLRNSETVNAPQQTDVFEKSEVNFKGKHDCAKFLGGLFGALGAAGAAGGILIMTGGLGAPAVPWILGYGAACAGTGAAFGHAVDKSVNNSDKK